MNFAINRRAMVQLAGLYGGQPHDQVLPPGFPGFRNANIYPAVPNVNRARALARGKTRAGKAVFFYGLTPPGPLTVSAGCRLTRPFRGAYPPAAD